MWIPTTAVDPYLVLRRGQGRDGQVVDSNDNVGSRNFNSSINGVLTAGTYTVEVTTCFGGLAGDFTPSVRLPTCVENLGPLTATVDRSNSAWVERCASTQRTGAMRVPTPLP